MESIKKFIPKHWLSFIAVIAFAISANTTINTEHAYGNWYALVQFDQGGYYGYLPGIWVHDDLGFEFYNKYGFTTKGIIVPLESGGEVNRYAIGPAVLLTPFYLIGHSIAVNNPTVYAPTGVSLIYKKWVLLGCIFYVTIALFLLRSILLRYYSDLVTMLTIITLGLGTNLLYYTTLEGMMSHAYSFFLYSLLLWSTVKWLNDSNKKALPLIGITMGLIACTRLPNLVVGLIPLLWGIKDNNDIKERAVLIWNQKWWILGALMMCIIGYAPQMIYYKIKVGKFFVDSYPNSRFWFDQPLAHRVMFSFRNGWLVYSPLMALGLTGFFLIKKYCKDAFIPLLSYFIVNMYVISSWWCWWYGGSFGMRALIETNALLSLTVAASIHYLVHHKFLKFSFILIFPLFIGLNILQTHQYTHNIIRFDGMNWDAYKLIFGKTDPVPRSLLEERDSLITYDYSFIKAASDKKYRYEECR